MKASSYIRFFLRFVICIFGVSALSILQSCTDDLEARLDHDKEDFTGITLLIPDVDNAAEFGATRSDGNANTRAYDTAKEANFNTLYIAAVKVKDAQGNDLADPTVQTFLKTSSNGVVESGEDKGYSKYRINLAEGYYRLYVVANMNRYITINGDETKTFADAAVSEENIRNLILNFTSSRPLEPGFLPMACLNEDIKVGENSTNAEKNPNKDAAVHIPAGENVYIYADLKFLCTKVRYTILFDKTKATLFGNGDIIDVHRNTAADYPYATNIRQYTAVNNNEDGPEALKDYVAEASGEKSIWPIFLDRYLYPSDFDFYTTTDNDAIKSQLDKIGQNSWSESNGAWNTDFRDKRVWQGVTYLPENLLTGEGERTLLKFPYSFNGATGSESPRIIELFKDGDGLARSMKYDVYVLITTPDAEQWQISIVPSDWTLQQLAYELHGPYELIVETSEVEKVSMEEEAVFWFRSDVTPEEIGFVSPQVSINGNDKDISSLRDLFVGGVLKNDDGSYATNANGDYLFHVGMNLEIPFDVIDKLNRSFASGKDGTQYTKKDISFFHIVAGSLQKRIEIKDLDFNPYLKVTPQTIIVDTRELYTSGKDNIDYDIFFETNVNPNENSVNLTLTDPSKLISTGQGEGVLKVTNPTGYKGSNDAYTLTDKTGKFTLNIRDIITGSPFWDKNNEYKLIFTLKVSREGVDDYFVTKEVMIKVRPFSGSYVIHFRDNTKHWEDPHIYVYQDLTLPSDMVYADGRPYEHAGKIVGYIERNPSSGLQWNAAVQYVFSNNLSFKGWNGNHVKGQTVDEYGGPEINDPWAKATWTDFSPSNPENSNNSTMGFVMFGDKKSDGSWNYDYAYNVTYGLDPNPQRGDRYNYDMNFNGDHEAGFDRWHCDKCKGMSPDYNAGGNDRFYTGITMEEEDDGWWKYTLTGVALPGRTMIIFANYHAPWDWPGGDYAAEDNRWPGDYESGLPLFDFEDNEGWFLFNGNTTEADQKFVDDKPVSKVIPHRFTSAYNNKLRIRVKSTAYTSITVNGNNVSRESTSDGISYFNVTNFSSAAATIPVVINGKTFHVAPKNFTYDSKLGMYVLTKPLYLEYDPEIKLFVKWNDQVSGQGYNPNGGTDNLTVYLGGSSTDIQTVTRSAKEYGNYKYVIFNPRSPKSNKGMIQFGLQSDLNFKKTLNVEKLPEYYIPDKGYYLINVHKL